MGGRRGQSKQQIGVLSSHRDVVTQMEVVEYKLTEQERVSSTGPVAVISPIRGTIILYATMTDPDEGTSLKFIQTPVIDGVKCAGIVSNAVNPKVEYWKFAMLCSVLGANPPLEVIVGFIWRIWKVFDNDKIYMVRKVVKREVFYFDKKPFLEKPWNEEMDINTEAITSISVLVRFLDLDIKYPIKIDKHTKEKTMLKYARLLMECQIEFDFPEFIEFINEHNVVVRQRVEYEWKPTRCSHCKMFGHTGDECRNKTLIRIEWRQVNRQETPEPMQQIDKESFITVKRRIRGSRGEKQTSYAIAAVAIHYIWRIRNEKIFSNHYTDPIQDNNDHIITRILTLNRFSGKYQNYIKKVIG
ncbi:hypothetical protein Cgig2_016071 [Carnegiea gigantea]|uniref:DUF4283 domain-containing protein n=1 Tax=Carnegiea gigantea TaxID=171969 RepID=A0A9Q1GV06_9CARY|nr:hypothetical protein Cgig2_016071 [Carnegiea gigantea]